ncbi:hypothetical protein OAA15_00530 [bacterium]|nr:hypothetical protein [bacterium]
MKNIILLLVLAFAVVGCEEPKQCDAYRTLINNSHHKADSMLDSQLAEDLKNYDFKGAKESVRWYGWRSGTTLSHIEAAINNGCDITQSYYDTISSNRARRIAKASDIIASAEKIRTEEINKQKKIREQKRKCNTKERCGGEVMREVRRTGSEIVAINYRGNGNWTVAVFKNSRWGIAQMIIDVQTDCDCNIIYSNSRMAR